MTSMQLREIYGHDSRLGKRFWSKVNVCGLYDCWDWKGAVNVQGYGHFGITRNGKHEYPNASRISYLLSHAELEDSLNVLHRCDNPLCVNPYHLYAGTQADNNYDSLSRGRWNLEPRIIRGERNHFAKLHDEDIEIIKAREILGERQTWLAAEYGVQSSAIWKVCNGYSWNPEGGE